MTALYALIFLIFLMFAIELAQRPPLETRDLRVWTDETERRLLARLPAPRPR